MPNISETLANLINGVSQQPPHIRLSSQAELQENALSSEVEGLTKRPPSRFLNLVWEAPPGGGDPGGGGGGGGGTEGDISLYGEQLGGTNDLGFADASDGSRHSEVHDIPGTGSNRGYRMVHKNQFIWMVQGTDLYLYNAITQVGSQVTLPADYEVHHPGSSSNYKAKAAVTDEFGNCFVVLVHQSDSDDFRLVKFNTEGTLVFNTDIATVFGASQLAIDAISPSRNGRIGLITTQYIGGGPSVQSFLSGFNALTGSLLFKDVLFAAGGSSTSTLAYDGYHWTIQVSASGSAPWLDSGNSVFYTTARYDQNRNFLWGQEHGANGVICEGGDGYLYLSCSRTVGLTGSWATFARLNPTTGAVLNTLDLGGTSEIHPFDVSSLGNIVIADVVGQDVYLYDLDFNEVWSQPFSTYFNSESSPDCCFSQGSW